MKGMLSLILGSYLVLVVGLYLAQRAVLYYPDPVEISPSRAAQLGLAHWPSTSEFRGFLAEPEGEARATAVIFHGNAGAALHRTYYAEALVARGVRVILAEYPGYGGRPGSPSESTLVHDGITLVDKIADIFDGPLLIWGESLGSGVAAAVAGNRAEAVNGVVMLTPFDSMAAVAQSHYWYLPARWLLKDRYPSQTHLSRFNGPVAVVLAGQDTVVPIRHGRALYDGLRGAKKLWQFESAGHNSLPMAVDESWWDEVLNFLSVEVPPST